MHVLARQPIDLDRPHPFTAAGNTEFNCLLWMPPNEQRAGDIVLVNSTNFTTLFGGTDSLRKFLAEPRPDEMNASHRVKLGVLKEESLAQRLLQCACTF